MRLIFSMLSLAATCYGLWWMVGKPPDLKIKVEELLHTSSFHTLEVRHTANQIMQMHRKELLKDNRHQFLEPSLKFYPYLLLEVKYVARNQTKEGIILWDLTDGEMIISTKNWEKTHGLRDCIQANTESHEFKILKVLAKNGGVCDKQTFSKSLHLENKILDSWIESCLRKKLIIQSGNRYRLHLQRPQLPILPQTKLNERLITQTHRHAECLTKRFSLSQIEKLTRAAFGTGFVIRSATDLYLPVHAIIVQKPDGSIHSSHWNAVNGKRLSSTH